MSSLIYELTKQSATIERLTKLDGVFSSFRTDQFSTGTPSQVYGVQPQHGFPKECNPNGLNNIAYFGVSPRHSDLSHGTPLHIIDFLYEERYKDGFRVGILEPALQMLKDKLGTIVVPRCIPEEWVDFWMNYFKNEFNCQKTLLQFVDKYNLQGSVDWTELYNTFSEDMDLKLNN